MRHALWPAVSLALLSATVPALRGAPRPLPAPLGQESDRLPAPPTPSGRSEALRRCSRLLLSPHRAGLRLRRPWLPATLQPGHAATGNWVPAEPTGPTPTARGPSGAAYPGHGDSYGYPPPGYGASSPDAYADPYRGRAAPPSYGGYAEPYPDLRLGRRLSAGPPMPAAGVLLAAARATVKP